MRRPLADNSPTGHSPLVRPSGADQSRDVQARRARAAEWTHTAPRCRSQGAQPAPQALPQFRTPNFFPRGETFSRKELSRTVDCRIQSGFSIINLFLGHEQL